MPLLTTCEERHWCVATNPTQMGLSIKGLLWAHNLEMLRGRVPHSSIPRLHFRLPLSPLCLPLACSGRLSPHGGRGHPAVATGRESLLPIRSKKNPNFSPHWLSSCQCPCLNPSLSRGDGGSSCTGVISSGGGGSECR